MPSKLPDLPALFRALDAESVRYVLIGGMAVALHGGSRVTFDSDLAIAFDLENRQRLVTALAPYHPIPKHAGEATTVEWDVLSIRGPFTVLQTDFGPLDIIITLPGVDSFEGLYERADAYLLGGQTIIVACIQDLIRMKEASCRPQDELDLLVLYQLQKLTES